MTLNTVLSVAGLLAIGFCVAASIILLLSIRRQRRAELRLVEMLTRDEAFIEALVNYAEMIYQYGEADDQEVLDDLEHRIHQILPQLGSGATLIRRTLMQATVEGRHRYLAKLKQEAIENLTELSVEDLELSPS
jgi:hypothetical protein